MRKLKILDAWPLGLLGFLFFAVSFTLDYLGVSGPVWRFSSGLLIGLSILTLAAALVITLVKTSQSK